MTNQATHTIPLSVALTAKENGYLLHLLFNSTETIHTYADDDSKALFDSIVAKMSKYKAPSLSPHAQSLCE